MVLLIHSIYYWKILKLNILPILQQDLENLFSKNYYNSNYRWVSLIFSHHPSQLVFFLRKKYYFTSQLFQVWNKYEISSQMFTIIPIVFTTVHNCSQHFAFSLFHTCSQCVSQIPDINFWKYHGNAKNFNSFQKFREVLEISGKFVNFQ